MSFYEQSKRGIVSAPFMSPDDKPKFEMSLQEWLGFRRTDGLRPATPVDLLLNELLTNSSNQNILRTSARTLFTFCARIETISCTAIVNAANESLLPVWEVAGLISPFTTRRGLYSSGNAHSSPMVVTFGEP
jgi:hypothetical protein